MTSLRCAGCAHANELGARFCAQCGASLAPRCSSCGAELPVAARFCSSCGAAVAADPVADGTLKVVSVVFADLVGSTALQESLDTESVRRVMTRFYERMRAVVERHEGALQKFIGDAVVVVFGAPLVREDDALRAVRCAVEMAAAVEDLNDELEPTFGVRLQIRTGVNTGELVVNDEGIFVGDTMNTAARFEQAAGPSEVLIGEATRRLVRHQAQLEDVAPLALKGKSEPVRAWRVLSVAAGPAERLAGPLVGRAGELARLRSVLDDAVRSRCCRLVSVIGSPGLGKSRLAQEFAAAVAGQATVVAGHCEPSGEGITFLPVADVLRSAAGIAEADQPDAVVEKLSALLPADADRYRLVARAAALLGAGESASPEETFWGVRRLLEALAGRRPLVVVLDDVHWGQPLFLDLIEHLVEWVRDAPLLLVALARPELREVRAALTSVGRRATDVIELEPLDSGESRELVDGLLGVADLPSPLLGRILETTDGNPLFLGELLRMLVDDGALVRTGDAWVAAGGADAVQVPPTIQALLTARIERLRPHERTVVERAAVIGKQFYRGAVAELVAPPVRAGIDGHLETLRRKDMVEPEGTYWIDEPVYRFHHVLIRDAAYHLLLKEARAELHEKFADWLAAKAGELVGEHEEVIAYHLEQAYLYLGQLGPLDERGRAIGTRAAELLWSAGRRALSREDLAAAANLLQRAHGCGAKDSVLWDLAEALLSAGDTASSAAVVEKLSGPRKVVLETQLAVLTGTGAELARVVAATSELAAADDGVGAAKGHHVTAQVQAQLGQVADVEASLDQALLAARKADDRRRITAVLAAAPRAALWGPSPVVRASGRCLDVVRILRMTPGNRHVEAVALRCQAVLEAMRERPAAARDILAAGRTTLEELGLTLELNELAMHAGIVELLAGQPAAASELLRSARDEFAALGVSVSAAQAAALLARALVEQGRDEEAAAETEYAEQHTGGDLKTTITWLGARAEVLARTGAFDDALALARRAVALAEPTDALADRADANMALAMVLVAAGRGDEARAVAGEAHRLYKEKDHVVGATRAERLAGARTEIAASSQPSDQGAVDPAVAGVLRRFDAAWRAHDREELLRIYPPGEAVTDHRRLGWGRLGGEKWADAVQSVLDMWADVRIEIAEVMACANGVIAARMKWLGQSSETRGEIEIDLGTVTVIRDGRMVSIDYYESDDREAMQARFQELAGQALGNRWVERLFAEHVRRLNAHDLGGDVELVADDFVWVDHRTVGLGSTHGRDSHERSLRGIFEMAPDFAVEVDDVVACDERVIALRSTYRATTFSGGAGEFERSQIELWVVDGDHFTRAEFFDPDAEISMRACFAEQQGLMLLGDQPPELWWRTFVELYSRQDIARIAEIHAQDFVMVDRRAISWEEVHGRQALADVAASSWQMAPDMRCVIDEVLACDESRIAIRCTFLGHGGEGGGQMEIAVGYVSVFKDGVGIQSDQFDHNDREGMLARYAELDGTYEVTLGDSPPERFWDAITRAFEERDLDKLADLFTDDFVLIDHRRLPWEDVTDRQALAKFLASPFDVSPDLRLVLDEVLGLDQNVMAVKLSWRGSSTFGGGEMLNSYGQVFTVRDGRVARLELFDLDAEIAIRACFEEQRGLGLLGDSPTERWSARFIERFGQHDREAHREHWSEDAAFVDHRALAWEEVRGREALIDLAESAWRMSSDIRWVLEEVLAADARVIVSRGRYLGSGGDGGGPLEIRVGYVTVVEDGLLVRQEQFDHDDTAAMLTRYAELGGGQSRLGGSGSERWWKQVLCAYARADLDRLAERYADRWVYRDHRELGWEGMRGQRDVREFWRSALDLSSAQYGEIDEVVAHDDRVIAVRLTWRGAAKDGGGGQFALPVGNVSVIEDGRAVITEQYRPDETDAMLARYAELSDAPKAVRGNRPAERLFADRVRRFNAHDVDGSLALVSDDFAYCDHRTISTPDMRGREPLARLIASIYDVAPDVRMDVEEVIASDGNVITVRTAYRGGSTGSGIGDYEVANTEVWLARKGAFAECHLFDADDRQAAIARYAELGGGTGPLGDRPPERWLARWIARYGRHDRDGLCELWARDCVFVDHRNMAWDALRGNEALLAVTESTWDVVPDNRCEVDEVLACDEHVIAVTCNFKGTAADGGGPTEIAFGWVELIENGVCTHVEQFAHDDREAMLARYAELGGIRDALGVRPPERWYARRIEAWNRRDRAALAALYSPDIELIDHRQLGWEVTKGRDALVELAASSWELLSVDEWLTVDEVLACDEHVIAVRALYRGNEEGAEFEIAIGQVGVVVDGLMTRGDQYDADHRQAMIARYAELGGGLAKLGRTKPERWWYEYAQHYAARDRDAVVAMHADGPFVDHRKLGWESAHTVEEAMGIIDGAWGATSDMRIEVDEVLASDERACALRIAWRGTEASYGGVWEIPMGVVTVVENGRSTHYEMFDPDDRDGILAKYEELRARARVRGPELAVRRYLEHYSARDIEGTLACYANGVAMRDHRQLALWADNAGQAQMRAQLESLFVSPEARDVRMEMLEVVACDDRVIADAFRLVGTDGVGGGEFEVVFGGVSRVTHGLIENVDLYDAEDRQAMIARYVELGGGLGPLGDRAPEQVVAEFERSQVRHDLDALLELLSPEVAFIDHRRLAWEEANGLDEIRHFFASAFEMFPVYWVEVDEVLACDDRVIAMRTTTRGFDAEGAGRFEISFGAVLVCERGRIVSWDQYDASDRESMLARYAELRRKHPVLGGSPVEQLVLQVTRSFNEHDFDRHLLQHADHFALVDHRTMGWAEVRGREAFAELVRSALAVSDDVRFDIEEVVACDGERVIALRGAWRGGGSGKAGAWEIPIGYVTVFKDGLLASHDFYDYDDTEAMRARFAELSTRPRLRGTPSEDAFDRRDLAAMAESYAEDIVLVDHRRAGREPVEGREAALEQAASLWRHVSESIQVVAQEVIAFDGRAFARIASYSGNARDGGGELDLALGQVGVMSGDQIERLEWFDPDDRWAMTARYAELGGGLSALGDRPPERVYAEFLRRWAAGDLERILELCAEDYAHVDHRPIGWETVETRDGFRQFATSVIGATCGFHCHVEGVLACDERIMAMRTTWRGHSTETASELEFKFGYMVITEQGLVVRQDYYDYDDVAGMLARYAELGGGLGALGGTLSERLFAQYAQRYAARDLDGLLEQVSEDWVLIDHRAVGWEELRVEEYAAQMQAVWDSVSVIWIEVDEVLVADDRVLAAIYTYRGLAAAEGGGGPFEYQVGYVGVNDGRQSIGGEFFDPDDREAMLARYAELASSGQPEPPPLRAMRQYARYWNAADADRASAMFAEDATILDHRQMAGEPIVGREAHRAFLSGAFELSPDNEMRIDEVIACDERVIAVLTTFAGTSSALEGGRAEIQLAQVRVYEGGVFVSSEMFEPDARQAVIARYAELGGGTSRLGDRPPERQVKEYARLFAARDIDGLLELHDERWTLTDHRQLGWDEVQGREQMAEVLRSGFELSTDMRLEVDEVLVGDERVIAMRVTWRGTAVDGGGQLDYQMGVVIVVEQGRAISHDQYDHDDSDAMLARFDELARPTGAASVLRAYLRALEQRDVDGLRAMVHPEIAIVDHRAIAGPPGRGPDAAMELARSAFGVTSELRFEIEEIIAQNDRAIACSGMWIGHAAEGEGEGEGEVTLPMALLMSVKDGRIAALESYEPDADEAIRVRFDELSLATLRPYHRFDRLYNERRLDELPALYTDDFLMVDRRSMAWEEIRGSQALVDRCRRFLDSAPDLRSVCVVLEEDKSGEFVLLRNTFTGQGYTAGGVATGPVELVFIEVTRLRGDVISRTELFDSADEPVARARFDLMRDRRPSPVRLYEAMCEAFNERDIERAISLHQPETVMRDHRQMPWEPTDTVHELAAVWRAVAESVTGARYEPEFHLVTDEHACVTLRVEAQPDYGGGPAEVVMAVAVGCRDGLMDRHELYDDPSDALVRTGELIGGGRGETVRLIARYLRAYRERDWEQMAQLWVPEAMLEDHRSAGLGSVEGVDEILQAIRGLAELVTDARTHAREFLGLRDDAALYRHEVSGHDPTGGAIAVEMLIAAKVVDGRLTRAEMFSLEAEPAARARFGEL